MRGAYFSLKLFRRSIFEDFPYFNGYHRQVPVSHYPRKQGRSNYGLGRALSVLRHAWALSSNPMAMRENLVYGKKDCAKNLK
jgi:hypothetical protein